MARIDNGFSRKRKQVAADVFSQCFKIAAFQVCTSDASLEESISAEQTVGCPAVEDQAARGVAGYMDGFQIRIPKADHIAVTDISSQRSR